MSTWISEEMFTNITNYIFKLMKESEIHIVGGYLNPYDFFDIAVRKAKDYWIPIIQKSITDSDKNIYDITLSSFIYHTDKTENSDEVNELGLRIQKQLRNYVDDNNDGIPEISSPIQEIYERFPEDVQKKFFTNIASLVQYTITNKSWLETEIGSTTANVPIYCAYRFKIYDESGNATSIPEQIDVEAYQREQQSSQTEQQQTYGNVITVMRPSIQTITDGVDTFMHKDYIEVLLPNGQYIATCVAVPSDGYSIFAFDTLYSEKVKMKTAGGISGGYEASNLRSYLQALYNSFPDDIKKKCIPFDNGDYLSIPTIAQLFGVDNMQNAVTGQIEYFKDRYHRIAYLDGDWCSYWCQDTSINHTFIICNKGGDFDYANSNNEEVGVRILFKLKNDSNKKVENKTGN